MSGILKKSKDIYSKNSSTKKLPLMLKLKPTGTAYLQVFGTGMGDTSPSVYLFADSQRYIFCCGESTQRLFHENKLKLGKINNLFLTQVSWNLIGGLPGLLMTLREIGKMLCVHGPFGLSQFLKSTRPFLSRQNLYLNCTEYTEKGSEQFEDENIIVRPIYIKGKEVDNFSYNSEITEIETCKVDKPVMEEANLDNNDKTTKQKGLDSNENPNPSKRCRLDISPKPVVSYVCQLTPILGKINIEKAIALGVPKGPMFGQLQGGQTVILENGTLVKPEDVIEQSMKGSVFCIIDCPSKHYFDNLIINKQLAMHEIGGEKTQPTIMIHLSPAVIVNMPEYVDWTKRFGNTCQHLFLNSEMSQPKIAMLSQLRIQEKLHELDHDIFPRLFTTDTPIMEIKGPLKENWKAAESFLIYHLRPSKKIGYDYSDIQAKWGKFSEEIRDKSFSSTTKLNDSAVIRNMGTELHLCRNDENLISESCDCDLNKQLKNNDENFEIVFLGTGASLPSKYRNVSSTLVNISKGKVMLLDCGEGTYGQLYRHYGPVDLEKILLRLSCVFISHIHADHHLGLIRVLQAWQKCTSHLPSEERPDPIIVVGPPSLHSWLRDYGTFYETLQLRFVDASKCQDENFIGCKTLSSVLESEKVAIVPVIHCFHAFGLVLTHRNGWKLVYSGDTRPCVKLIKEGLGATVLIHEATFEDDLQAEAIGKYHCTTTEAIQCGQKMNAEFILLNHFSQRYPKIPVFNEKYNDRTGIAFDHMKVNFRNISRVSKLLQPLQEVFKEEISEQKIYDERILEKT